MNLTEMAKCLIWGFPPFKNNYFNKHPIAQVIIQKTIHFPRNCQDSYYLPQYLP